MINMTTLKETQTQYFGYIPQSQKMEENCKDIFNSNGFSVMVDVEVQIYFKMKQISMCTEVDENEVITVGKGRCNME